MKAHQIKKHSEEIARMECQIAECTINNEFSSDQENIILISKTHFHYVMCTN